MKNLRTVLFYILGLALLAWLTIFFAGQTEVDIRPLPTATPTVTPTPLSSEEAADVGCISTPFTGGGGYLPGAPITTTLAPLDFPGERMVISGTVYASDCATPLSEVMVEVWHTDSNGQYDQTEPYNLRGRIETDAAGHYQFTTIKPRGYMTGETPRPAHIHYLLRYQGYDPLVTILFFADDPLLVGATVDPRIVTSLEEKMEAEGAVLYGTFDIVLPVSPPAPTPEIFTDEDL